MSTLHIEGIGQRVNVTSAGLLINGKRAPFPVKVMLNKKHIATIRQDIMNDPPWSGDTYEPGRGWVQYKTFCIASLREVSCPKLSGKGEL